MVPSKLTSLASAIPSIKTDAIRSLFLVVVFTETPVPKLTVIPEFTLLRLFITASFAFNAKRATEIISVRAYIWSSSTITLVLDVADTLFLGDVPSIVLFPNILIF